MAERQLAEADALRIGSATGGVRERIIQQCIGRRIAGVPVVHPGGGESEHADRRTGRLGVLFEVWAAPRHGKLTARVPVRYVSRPQ